MAKTDCAAADTRCLCESEHFLGYLRYCSGKLCSEKHEKRGMPLLSPVHSFRDLSLIDI